MKVFFISLAWQIHFAKIFKISNRINFLTLYFNQYCASVAAQKKEDKAKAANVRSKAQNLFVAATFCSAVDDFAERLRMILGVMHGGMAAHGRMIDDMKTVPGLGWDPKVRP